MAVMRNWIHPKFVNLVEQRDVLSSSGLYLWLRSQGASIQVAKQRIGARRANKEEAQLLDLENGSPVLTMHRTAFDSTGSAIEYGEHCYRTDLYSFELTIVER